MQGLDQFITGNWGEDSVPPEFIKAEELGDLEGVVKIDVGSGIENDHQIVATVERVTDKGHYVSVWAKEFAYPFVIDKGTPVYFADDEDGS